MSTCRENHKITLVFIAVSILVFSLFLESQERQEAPPEYRLLRQARRIDDPEARLAELERIKAAYPDSKYSDVIQRDIISTKIELSTTLEEIFKWQSQQFQRARGLNRLLMFYYAGLGILQHRNISQFDKKKVTEIILLYADEANKLAKNPEFLQKIPEERKPVVKRGLAMRYLMIARAYLNEGSAPKAKDALALYVANGGEQDNVYWYTRGIVYEKLDEIQEAFDSFMNAAAQNFGDSVEKAKELYRQLRGSVKGFDDLLVAEQRGLPFQPKKFKPSQEWQGKSVLAELFTGSECRPCVAADLGVDGLIEAYSEDYLVILEYHLPIPRPDPIMNVASRARAIYYGINSTPTVYIDGEKELTRGGYRSRAKAKFDEYSTEINARMYEPPQLKLSVSAKRNGDDVRISASFDRELSNADYNLVLVEEEVEYAGSNGILFHKNVVRDFKTVIPGEVKNRGFSFNILEAENAGANRLAEYEREINFSFKEKHFKIDRTRLQVIFFVQDRSSHKVYNAAVCKVQ